MTKGFVLPLVALAMMGLALAHVVRANQPKEKLSPPVEPTRNPFEGGIAGSGVVEPRSENIAIGSPLSGVVDRVAVRVGQSVKKGDELFTLDTRHLKADLSYRQAMRDAALASLDRLRAMPRKEEVPPIEAKLREARANLDDQKDQFERAANLRLTRANPEEDFTRRRNAVAIAQAQMEKADAELALLKKGAWEADLVVAAASVKQADAQMKQIATELERSVIRAPIDCEVLQITVRPGEFVDAKSGQMLMVLGDVAIKHIRVDIDENDIPRFESGVMAKAFPRGAPGKAVSLKFVRVEPYVVPKRSLSGASTERIDVRVLQVIYAIEAGSPNLYIGQQVDVNLNTSIALPSGS